MFVGKQIGKRNDRSCDKKHPKSTKENRPITGNYNTRVNSNDG